MLKYVFNERKAAQAAAFLLRLHGGPLNYMVLIKLLYLADRRSLIEVGKPITGDTPFSLAKGPVLSRILDFINSGYENESTPWFEYISEPNQYEVSLIPQDPETDELSRFEERVLTEIHTDHGSRDKWDLVHLTHALPEWEDPNGSSLRIDPRRILREAGKSSDEIRRISQDLEELWLFAQASEASAQ